MKILFHIMLFIIISLFLIGCTNIDERSIENVKELESETSTNEMVDIIYEDNEKINLFLNKYNDLNEDKITSEMLNVYYHHGSNHKDQVKVVLDEFNAVITGGTISDNVSVYIDNKDNNDENIKKLIIKIVKVFDATIKDEDIIKNLNSQGGGSNIDTFDNIEFWTNKNIDGSRIEYIKITGKIK